VHATEKAPINLSFRGIPNSKMVSWRALYTEDIHNHNTFEHPTQVEPKNETITGNKFQIAPASVNILQFEI
jgi:alpha-L-arabinofuranosidase